MQIRRCTCSSGTPPRLADSERKKRNQEWIRIGHREMEEDEAPCSTFPALVPVHASLAQDLKLKLKLNPVSVDEADDDGDACLTAATCPVAHNHQPSPHGLFTGTPRSIALHADAGAGLLLLVLVQGQPRPAPAPPSPAPPGRPS